MNFTVSIEKKDTRFDKNGEEVTKNISYILQFIDSARFMASLLSNPINNLSEGIHKIKCKYRHDDKKYETCRIKYKYCDYLLECTNFKDYLIKYKYLCRNKNLTTTTIRFFLFLRKDLYPYEYMDDSEKVNETSLPEKEDFYSHLIMEDITDADYAHTKIVCNDFETKYLWKYHDLYV